jgi:hypothetical protein
MEWYCANTDYTVLLLSSSGIHLFDHSPCNCSEPIAITSCKPVVNGVFSFRELLQIKLDLISFD